LIHMDAENTTRSDEPARKPEQSGSARGKPAWLVRDETIIERIIGWCAHNQFLVLVGVMFLIVAGVIAVKHVRLDAIPDLSDVQVVVFTEWPGRDPQLVEEFWRAFGTAAAITLHISLVRGKNTHHIIEACFKSVARSLRDAVKVEGTGVPSTKGTL